MPICGKISFTPDPGRTAGKRGSDKQQIHTLVCHVVDDTVDDLTLERLEHNRAIARDELGLAIA
jgi:hypothetical protein